MPLKASLTRLIYVCYAAPPIRNLVEAWCLHIPSPLIQQHDFTCGRCVYQCLWNVLTGIHYFVACAGRRGAKGRGRGIICGSDHPARPRDSSGPDEHGI
jgi:hypothetical protein